ncbi:hypothetical protein FQR65_LT20144 [Abscondita terminalis]|nr:hypothetical protein FQR65_LT20144 [Abscondita terminalis]
MMGVSFVRCRGSPPITAVNIPMDGRDNGDTPKPGPFRYAMMGKRAAIPANQTGKKVLRSCVADPHQRVDVSRYSQAAAPDGRDEPDEGDPEPVGSDFLSAAKRPKWRKSRSQQFKMYCI